MESNGNGDFCVAMYLTRMKWNCNKFAEDNVGSRTPDNEKIQVDVTRSMQELTNILGISITGLDGFGSHAQSLSTENTASKHSATSDTTSDATQSLVETSVDLMSEHWASLLNIGKPRLYQPVQSAYTETTATR